MNRVTNTEVEKLQNNIDEINKSGEYAVRQHLAVEKGLRADMKGCELEIGKLRLQLKTDKIRMTIAGIERIQAHLMLQMAWVKLEVMNLEDEEDKKNKALIARFKMQGKRLLKQFEDYDERVDELSRAWKSL